jgi:uncharacterized protein (TIGR00296 family)
MHLSEGQRAVKLARTAIEVWTRRREKAEPGKAGTLSQVRGAFVSIHTFPGHSLRGCIGFPEPVMPLGKALVEAALSACHDPRFPPLRSEELDSIIVEVSVLTEPRPLRGSPKDRPSAIKTGRDGLMVRKPPFSGLLLPQVATEYGFSAEEFLSQCCRKAGLPPSEWLSESCQVLTFRAEVFSEEKPNGNIVKK